MIVLLPRQLCLVLVALHICTVSRSTIADGCSDTPCLLPSQFQTESLISKLELAYPYYFSPTTTATQQLTEGNAIAYYRLYNNALGAGLASYQGALWYALSNVWRRYSSLDEANQQFCDGTCWGMPAAGSGFSGNVVLGVPTVNSIKANVFSTDQNGIVSIQYGRSPGGYTQQTPAQWLVAGKPLELTLNDLEANSRYYYRVVFQDSTHLRSGLGEELSFHTARPAGEAFRFAIQGDSHPERVNSQFNAELYARTLQTAAADTPDFYLTIGDDFSVDNLNPATLTQAQVVERYTLQRPYLGIIGKTAPVFLVNGNHEQAARYLLDGTANNVAVWAQNARNSHYSQPAPDNFYSGNTEEVPFIGKLRNYFAWTWGDALFVTLDPYWASPQCVDNPFYGGTKRSSLWDVTHGDAQYQWLKKTLEESKAKYKFVFAHHVMGTGRGGIELANKYEWGGLNANGVTSGFLTNRPQWPSPIHQLMADNHVTIFFQGHDHIWVKQQLDGVIYQTLSEPADPNYSLFNADAYLTGTQFPNSGYTRVTVSPAGVKVDYVRTYLKKDESAAQISGESVYSYTIQ